MKKVLCIVVTAAICLSFIGCSKKSSQNTAETSQITTTTEPATSTTAPVKEDKEQGEKLKKAVKNAIDDNSQGSLSGNFETGSFKYIFNRNPSVVYANERSDEFEKLAYKNAEKLVESIKSFYKDEIKFDRMYPNQIGSGENGTDSIRYEFFYINSQNQQLKIYADSDGVISFVQCNFTW